jgi:hypothetical protein
VVLHFPFSDLSQTKRRPALALATLNGNDVILCQITSQAKSDQYSVVLDGADFESGGLNQPGRIRPNRLFTADSGIVLYATGCVRDGKLRESASAVLKTLDRQSTESGSVHKEVASEPEAWPRASPHRARQHAKHSDAEGTAWLATPQTGVPGRCPGPASTSELERSIARSRMLLCCAAAISSRLRAK